MYQYPSQKAMKKIKEVVRETVNQRFLLVRSEEEMIKIMNPKIIGWRNYYSTGKNGTWMRSLDWYILCTFVRWHNKKHQQTRKLKDITMISKKLKEKGLQKMAA